MKSIRQLLHGKSGQPYSVAPTDTVYTALQRMAEKDVGALLVLDAGRLVGIFSERDYSRKIALHGKTAKETPVSTVMTEKVLYVTPEHTVSQCLAIMTEKHIRHLPVLDQNQNVVGVVSIGDLVKEKISEQSFIIEQLERYIAG